jgi:hypothetical protein
VRATHCTVGVATSARAAVVVTIEEESVTWSKSMRGR